MNLVLWQGIAFTAGAVLLMVLLVWWLYGSRLSPAKGFEAVPPPPPPGLAAWIALWMGLAGIQLVAGGFWDASQHITTGVIVGGSDFLWPSHIMIYSSFLVCLVVAMAALAYVAIPGWREGIRDPRVLVRHNPYLGAVAVASLYELLAIPGDALWHELFGIDLTAWSPPHLLIGIAMSGVLASAAALLMRSREANSRGLNEAVKWLLGIMLLVLYLFATLEWELRGVSSPAVAGRPIWAFPVAAAVVTVFVIQLARRMSASTFPALETVARFYLIRFAITVAVSELGLITPVLPLAGCFTGALLLDRVPWERIARPFLRYSAGAATFAVGHIALAVPQAAARADLPRFGTPDYFITAVVTFAAALCLLPLADLSGRWLAGKGRT